MGNYIKNVEHEKVFEMTSEVEIKPGQVISKTLAQNGAVSLTAFAFAKGEEISTHASDGDALVTVLEGIGRFTVAGEEFLLKAGQSLVMPAGKPHSVYAEENFKMFLTVIF